MNARIAVIKADLVTKSEENIQRQLEISAEL
jgi:hypothetical protein